MTESTSSFQRLFRDLQERAKELNCVYRVEELTSDPEAELVDILRDVVAAVPAGWQYSDVCQARITLNGQTYESAEFRPTPWVLSAPICLQGQPVGTLEVFYTQEMPHAHEGPFLREERRLIDTIADRISSCIMHRELVAAMKHWRTAEQRVARRTMHDWSVILDLLRRTDQSLLMRVARKMINHLCWSGVKEAENLLPHFRFSGMSGQHDLYIDANQPRSRERFPTGDTLVDEAFRIAAVHLSDEEIVTCVHSWIKQDRSSFLVNALENQHTSLSEVADAISRFQHAAHGEVELSDSTLKALRVSLIRRFLSDQLEYINVAKRYVDIKDFHELLQRTIYPAEGHGRLGGKGAGLFLARQVVRHCCQASDPLSEIRTPRTWYLASDGLHSFVHGNHLEDVFTQKYKDVDQVRQEYPDIVQVFKNSLFPADIVHGLSVALDEFGEHPIIVRSSSLLEDRFGAAFSGKYKSLFLANQGTKQERMAALLDAIAEVYASTFSPDPIEYRAERNLLDFQEGMGVLIQEVVGTRVGDYFLPAFAGVAFSYNEFRWSPRIRREDGLVRLVAGLGTRAVDRTGDDYPILVSPGQPNLRANASVEETVRYSPRFMDVIYLPTNSFETVNIADLLRECGDRVPGIERIVSVLEHGQLRQPMLGQVDFERDDLVVTFEGLLTRTPFIKQIHTLLELLQKELDAPIDIEFASDGRHLYLLQCRTQTPGQQVAPAPIPRDIPPERVIFTAHRHVSNGTVSNITHVVYVDPERYGELGREEDLIAVGRAVGRLNKILPKRQFILMGPGRWGSRGDIKLGVKVTYSDINNTAMLIEIARRKGDYTPDLSFGTHFFQDLVEASIRYLPLYPDEEGVLFSETFLKRSGNILPDLAPELAELRDVIYVIDVPKAADGQTLCVLMNADLNEAVGVLVPVAAVIEAGERPETGIRAQSGQDWRWRMRMAEHIADQLDPERFAVKGLYVFGSTKNATASSASDIDLLVHFTGNDAQRRDLLNWLEGWSLALSEMNYLRTGYKTEGLLDVHIVTDEDIARRTSFAVKIDAITDAARPLPLRRR